MRGLAHATIPLGQVVGNAHEGSTAPLDSGCQLRPQPTRRHVCRCASRLGTPVISGAKAIECVVNQLRIRGRPAGIYCAGQLEHSSRRTLPPHVAEALSMRPAEYPHPSPARRSARRPPQDWWTVWSKQSTNVSSLSKPVPSRRADPWRPDGQRTRCPPSPAAHVRIAAPMGTFGRPS